MTFGTSLVSVPPSKVKKSKKGKMWWNWKAYSKLDNTREWRHQNLSWKADICLAVQEIDLRLWKFYFIVNKSLSDFLFSYLFVCTDVLVVWNK